MTGAFVLVKRKGKCQIIEFELLTDKEMEEFSKSQPNDGWKWAIFFAKFLRDEMNPLLNGLVRDGILKEKKGD